MVGKHTVQSTSITLSRNFHLWLYLGYLTQLRSSFYWVSSNLLVLSSHSIWHQLVWISALISHSGCPNTQDLLWFALFLGILNLLDHVIKTFPPQKAKPPGPPQTQVIRI